MSMDFHVIIPARYESTRLPGKLLMELGGLTVIERVYRQVLKAHPKSVIIATDSKIIAERAEYFGAKVMMTAATHQCGTDRIGEVVTKAGFAADSIIVNVQADEPLIDPALIMQVAHDLNASNNSMTTLCWPLDNQEQLHNPNVVKVVRDKNNNALYFSRAAIPVHRDNSLSIQNVFRHIGLYAYRARFLLELVRLPACDLETVEAIEQLRVLWEGYKIQVEEACVKPLQDINTLEDLLSAREWLSKKSACV